MSPESSASSKSAAAPRPPPSPTATASERIADGPKTCLYLPISAHRPGRLWGALFGGPLVLEDCEDEFVAPLALEDLGLAEVGLLAHAEAPHQGRRGLVAGVGAAVDAVGAEALEAEDEQLAGRLGRVALSLLVGMEGEADLDLAVLTRAQPDRNPAEQGAALAPLDRERERVAVLLEPVGGDVLGQRWFDLLALARLPVEETGDLGPRLNRGEPIEVVHPETPQPQPLGLDRLPRSGAAPTVPRDANQPRAAGGASAKPAICSSGETKGGE